MKKYSFCESVLKSLNKSFRGSNKFTCTSDVKDNEVFLNKKYKITQDGSGKDNENYRLQYINNDNLIEETPSIYRCISLIKELETGIIVDDCCIDDEITAFEDRIIEKINELENYIKKNKYRIKESSFGKECLKDLTLKVDLVKKVFIEERKLI